MIKISRKEINKTLRITPNVSHFPTFAPRALADCEDGRHVWIIWMMHENNFHATLRCSHCGKDQEAEVTE